MNDYFRLTNAVIYLHTFYYYYYDYYYYYYTTIRVAMGCSGCRCTPRRKISMGLNLWG